MSEQSVPPAVPLNQTRNTDNLSSFNAYAVIELSDGQAVNVQMTMRHGMSGEVMARDLSEYVKFLNFAAMEHGAKFGNIATSAPAKAPPTQSAATTADKIVHAALEDVGAPPAGKTWQTVDVDKAIVTPLAGGLTQVEFWRTDRKFAEERVKWKNEQVVGLLKHVGIDATKPQEIVKPLRVWFTLGKEYVKSNGQTSNYHDIGHVRAL
jgi:hypothetical protein